MYPTKVQRWVGLTRTVSDWDHGLRRDPELWYEGGDCYVHLHAKGASRRGPSFCVPFRLLRQKKCDAMLIVCDAQIASAPGSASQRLRRMPSSLNNANRQSSVVELFIPASEESSQDSFRQHITTRNFFAFLLGKPLVGDHMGRAFVDLQERLHLFRPSHANNHQDFLEYAENQGYRDLVECTDYALASLFYAEHYKLRDIWVDAFAHCVGMSESLVLSPEYVLTSKLTKALITRANLEVDSHLGRVSIALSKFLQEDLSPTYLGLTDGARSHLDRFRRFLHTFYVGKFGYWPPPRGATFPKALYKSMYYDFQNLYDYLVDTESTADISSQRPASGGLCVLQNVMIFDRRHGFKPQPHLLPLLPMCASSPKRTNSHKVNSQKALRQIILASQHNKSHLQNTMHGALVAATNTLDPNAMESSILQAYIQFEKAHAINSSQREGRTSATDARKVRWLVIYGTLQYLVSALCAPKEVRDSESPEYALCYVAESIASTSNSGATTPLATPSINVPLAIEEYLAESQSSPYSIEPDCQREDYFTPRNLSRRGSMEVAPLKISQPLRSSSVRSFARRSLSARSSRRNSLTSKPTQKPAGIMEDDGTGSKDTAPITQFQSSSRQISSVYSESVHSEQSTTSVADNAAGLETSWLRSRTPSVSRSRQTSTGSIVARPRTPLLDSIQLERATCPTFLAASGEPPSRSDSTSSIASSLWSEGAASATSSKSSASGEIPIHKTNAAEESGLLGGLVSFEIPKATASTRPQSQIHPLLRKQSPQTEFEFGFEIAEQEVTHDVHEHSGVDMMIGMAVSTPPPPVRRSSLKLFPDTQPTFTAEQARSLIAEKRPYLPPRAISTSSAPDSIASPKRGVTTPAPTTTTPSGYWEQYKATLTQQRARSKTVSSSGSTPSSIVKMPTALKASFSRIGPRNEDDRGVKRERRLSTLWRH
ncbi:hypothetical protein G6011_06558 [Alternaria panax]|uniref:DUF8004 domain-containing protein n=1 Tax=Alternaria panax TaxID=48097 RepID=A0AAD4I5K8_9PLEO|nr:hypothetical protein G6011_06558 [Alternaria panax]